MHPDVSVLLPYRDAAETIEEALDSVLAQRGVVLELILVDDRSTDDGAARVASHTRGRANVVRIATGGPAPSGTGIVAALTLALRAARAPVIARMDADDVCLPDRLVRQLRALEESPRVGAVGCLVDPFCDRGSLAEGMRLYVEWQNSLVSPADHARELFVESPLCHPSVTLRRSALDEVGAWREGAWPEDYDLWLRLAAAGWRLAKVPEVLLRWRNQPGRATFADPRYSVERFVQIKAPHLAREISLPGRPIVVWGAGRTGKRLARALEPHGVRARIFVDIDPRKIGRVARSAPIVSRDALRAGEQTVVVAVAARGARELIRADLRRRGFVEGRDYWCAA